jgi:hypothetical protein
MSKYKSWQSDIEWKSFLEVIYQKGSNWVMEQGSKAEEDPVPDIRDRNDSAKILVL